MNTAKKILALAAAVAVTGMSMPALAEAIPTEGDPVSVTDGSTKEYVGDIAAEDQDAVTAKGGSNVSLEGDIYVVGKGDGVDARQDSTVNIDGSVAIVSTNANDGVAAGDSTVNVSGSVSATGERVYGVEAWGTADDEDEGGTNAFVEVDGGITVDGKNSKGINVENRSTVVVDGDVTATGENTNGAVARYNSTVLVWGDVEADGENSIGVKARDNSDIYVENDIVAGGKNSVGVDVDSSDVTVSYSILDNDEGTAVKMTGLSNVIVYGSIIGDNIALSFNDETDPGSTIVAECGIMGMNSAIHIDTEWEGAFKLPTIVTDSLMTSDEGTMISGVSDSTAQRLLASIAYIVYAENGMTVVDGTHTVEIEANDMSYEVANIGDTITLKPVVPKGYKMKGIDFGAYDTTVIDNGDGTYTVTVGEEGQLYFYLDLKKVKKDTENTTVVSVGDKIQLANSAWILTAIDANTGVWTLASVDAFTDDQLEDMEGLLDNMLTETEMKSVKKDSATGEYVWQIGNATAAAYFGGNTNHITIDADPAIFGM